MFTSSYIEAANTLAVIASSNEPLLFLAGDLSIIIAAYYYCGECVVLPHVHIDPAGVPGRQLSELGAGEWGMPQLTSLLKATASGGAEIVAYEIDLMWSSGPILFSFAKASPPR